MGQESSTCVGKCWNKDRPQSLPDLDEDEHSMLQQQQFIEVEKQALLWRHQQLQADHQRLQEMVKWFAADKDCEGSTDAGISIGREGSFSTLVEHADCLAESRGQ
mmetsp:Transcript_9784/g.23330  ORF Transcript_9784/g.23330 Transcript_9784/m.23330 type:complete len:105 (-) Transcript_9784:87-401(-)